MLPKTHQEQLLSWLELLKSLDILFDDEQNNIKILKDKWYQIQSYLQTEIMTLDSDDLEKNQRSLFQSWQTETYRYIRLLETDFFFYQSAKQTNIKQSRFLIIKQRLQDAINLTNNYFLTVNN